MTADLIPDLPERGGAVATEIWQAAHLLVERLGDEAPTHASRWAHALLEAGEVAGRMNRMHVMVACKGIPTQGRSRAPPGCTRRAAAGKTLT